MVQVLACLRLLSYDAVNPTLASHLMQIRTGEGKSIILGFCAVICALLGFKVRCVCYSEHLSKRDYEDFLQLFKVFKVEDRISYSKITCFSEERALAKCDIREFTAQMLHDKVPASKVPASKVPARRYSIAEGEVNSSKTVAAKDPVVTKGTESSPFRLSDVA